jgi:hypothetical protein
VCIYFLLSMPLYALLGAYIIPLIFTLPSLLCTVYIYRRLPETRGREIGDIVNELMK